MSLYNDASLAMIPSAVKDGKLYSIRPTDGSGDFTFSRGSNLAATRVDVNGLIEKGRENLLLQSNQFDTTWTLDNASVTSGQSGYDGSSDAWLLQATASTSTARLKQVVSLTGVHTTSIYAKAGSTDWIAIQMWSNHFAYFDVANGVVGNSGSAIDASIEAAGNGFYRCSISYNASSVGNLWVYVIDGNGSTSVTSGKNVYLQSAQLEVGLVATDYIESTTTTAVSGITEDLPRLDYSGGASCPSLLLEPTRTNLMPQSEVINLWVAKVGVTIETNTTETLSPEGLYNATKLTATHTDPNIYQPINVTADPHTMSFYVKGVGNSIGKVGRILFWYIGTATGTTTSHNFTLNGDWQRIEATTTPTGAGSLFFRIDVPADNSVVGDEAYIYGVQVEQGSYPSSYIPTYGSAVTRSKDAMNEQISSLTSIEQGTFFLDFDRGLTNGTARDGNTDGFFYRSGSSFPATNAIEIATDVDGNVRAAIRMDGFLQLYLNDTLSRYKILFKWSGTSVNVFVNGALVYDNPTRWTATLPLQYIGYHASFRKSVNQLLTFPTALTDSECIALTAI
jgi:hypothetical protein